MTIDEEILVNRLAQGIAALQEGQSWFESQSVEQRRDILRGISFMIAQASPRPDDAEVAIRNSGLKATFTPCVLLTRGEIRTQLGKIASLPEHELTKAFPLLISLLGVSDERRRTSKPLDLGTHWWHRDLRDPEVIEAIRREFRY